MYRAANGQRLVASDDGVPLPQNRVTLTTVSVQPAVPTWRWALALGWLGLVAVVYAASVMQTSVKVER
jgi:hypothetical protein